MASPTDKLHAYVQSVYLLIKGRYFDDLTGDDGIDLINKTIDWTNQYLDELESELNTSGHPVNWKWSRTMGATLGTALQNIASIDFDTTTYSELIADENRFVQVTQGGIVISNWAVVTPEQISSATDRITQDMCALVGAKLIFSRVFKDTENNGTIIGDVLSPLPRMSLTNVKVLDTVKPKQLLLLGVAKNATLPDIVQGGLSPSYVQKYGDLLKNAIAQNEASALADVLQRDNFSGVTGIY